MFWEKVRDFPWNFNWKTYFSILCISLNTQNCNKLAMYYRQYCTVLKWNLRQNYSFGLAWQIGSFNLCSFLIVFYRKDYFDLVYDEM